MTIITRYYVFEDDGTIKRVPNRVAGKLPSGMDAIPEYANTRKKVAEIVVDWEDRKPIQILDAIGTLWCFDEEGYIDEHLLYEVGQRIDLESKLRASAARREGSVVDLVPELKRQELERRQRWTLTKEELDYIAADIWPGYAGEFTSIKAVKGKAPRKPRVTWEAKNAIQEIGRSLGQISFRLVTLNEISLAGRRARGPPLRRI